MNLSRACKGLAPFVGHAKAAHGPGPIGLQQAALRRSGFGIRVPGGGCPFPRDNDRQPGGPTISFFIVNPDNRITPLAAAARQSGKYTRKTSARTMHYRTMHYREELRKMDGKHLARTPTTSGLPASAAASPAGSAGVPAPSAFFMS
jgi:hypothetical protein